MPDLSDFYLVHVSSIFGDDPRDEVNEFFERYRRLRRGADDLRICSRVQRHRGVRRAAQRADTPETADLLTAMNQFDAEPLRVGQTTYTEDLHITLDRPMVMLEIQNGKPAFLESDPESVPEPDFAG